MNNSKFGFRQLARKSLTMIAAAMSALTPSKASVTNPENFLSENDKNLNFEHLHKNVLTPKMVLKLNMLNPEKSFVDLQQKNRQLIKLLFLE